MDTLFPNEKLFELHLPNYIENHTIYINGKTTSLFVVFVHKEYLSNWKDSISSLTSNNAADDNGG